MKINLKSSFLLLSALLAVSVSYSCRKSSDAEPAAEAPADITPLTVTGRIGGSDTKVTYTIDSDKISQKWAVGDTIIGIDDATTPKTYTYVVSKVNGDGTASFTFVKGGSGSSYGTATDNPSYGTTMYMIYAPGYAAKDFSSGGSLSIDISKQDSTIVGTSASGLHIPGIMTATGTVTIDNKLELTFTNQLELLMIENPTLSGRCTATTITSFTVSGSETLPTTATFSASGFAVDNTSGGTVTKNCSLTTTTTGTTTGTVLIALMPATEQNLIIKSSNFYTDTLKSHTPTASRLLKVSGATFSAVMTGVTISSTAESIDIDSTVTLTYTVQAEGAAVTSAAWSSSNENVATVDASTGKVTGKALGTADIYLTVNGTFKDTCTVTVPSVFLPGEFSVSATKTVKFTNGNLYWDGSAFHLEDNQTDYPTTWNASHVWLFYWTNLTDYQSGTASYMPYAETCSYSSRSTKDKFWCCEDNKLTADGQSGLYALDRYEWTYLVKTRKNASSLYKNEITVTNGSKSYPKCFIIAPDNYSGTPLDSISDWSLSNINSLGLVCLPKAGYRDNGTKFNASTYAFYWTSSPKESNVNQAYYMNCYVVNSSNAYYRYRGIALRLVATVSE